MKKVLALVAVVLTAACGDLSTNANSEQARVVLTGDTPVDIRVITSTQFGYSVDPETGDRETVLVQADTVATRAPFDETYDITQFGIFLVRVVAESDTISTIDLRISIDGDTKVELNDATIAADSTGTPGSFEWSWIS